MARNKLTDLNDHFFAELERLGDEDLRGDDLREELERAKGIARIGSQVIKNADTMLSAARYFDDRMNADIKVPELLLGDSSAVRDK